MVTKMPTKRAATSRIGPQVNWLALRLACGVVDQRQRPAIAAMPPIWSSARTCSLPVIWVPKRPMTHDSRAITPASHRKLTRAVDAERLVDRHRVFELRARPLALLAREHDVVEDVEQHQQRAVDQRPGGRRA